MPDENTLIRREKVEELTGLKRSSLYHKVKKGQFPKPVPIGPHMVAWIEAEVREWITHQIAKRDSGEAA